MTLNELNLLFKAEDLVFLRTSLSHSHTVAGGGHELRISVSKALRVNYLPTSGQSCSRSRLNNSPLLCASGNIIKAATFLLLQGFLTVIRLVSELEKTWRKFSKLLLLLPPFAASQSLT